MVGQKSLVDHYRLAFSMMQHHKWSIADIEELLPYEMEIYVIMLRDHIQEIEEQQRKN